MGFSSLKWKTYLLSQVIEVDKLEHLVTLLCIYLYYWRGGVGTTYCLYWYMILVQTYRESHFDVLKSVGNFLQFVSVLFMKF